MLYKINFITSLILMVFASVIIIINPNAVLIPIILLLYSLWFMLALVALKVIKEL